MLRLRYAMQWLRFKVVNGINPDVSLLPAAQGARGMRWHRYGFVAFVNGKSVSVSWRFWAQGPCSYATFAFLRGAR